MADNVSAVVEAFTQLDCFEFSKVSMYNQALFYSYIHRFRVSNLTYGNSWSQFGETDVLPSFVEEQSVPKIVELGSNPRKNTAGVAITSDQPVMKKARIDDHQYQVTATAPTRVAERHPQVVTKVPAPRPAYQPIIVNTEVQIGDVSTLPQSSRNRVARTVNSMDTQQHVYSTDNVQQYHTRPANNLMYSEVQSNLPTQPSTSYTQPEMRAYSAHKQANNCNASTLQQPQAELTYAPAAVGLQQVSLSPLYQFTPDYTSYTQQRDPNGYGVQSNGLNVQQQYYSNDQQQEYVNSTCYYSQQQSVNNSNEYVNYR